MRQLLPFLKPYRYWILLKLASATTNAANDIALVYEVNQLFKAALRGDWHGAAWSIAFMLATVIAGVAINFVETYASGRFSANVARDLKNTFAERMNGLPIAYLEAKHSGELNSMMSNGIASIERFFQGSFGFLLFNAIRLAASIVVMAMMNWQMLLLCMIMLPLMALLSNAISRPLASYSATFQSSLAQANATAQDALNGIHLIKAYTLIPVFSHKFRTLVQRMLSHSLAIERRAALTGSVNVFVQLTPFLVFLGFGAYLAIHDRLTAGGLVAFAMLLNYFVGALSVLPNLWNEYKLTSGVTRQLFEVLAVASERMGDQRPQSVHPAYALKFDRVSYAYDGQKRVLQAISFAVRPGSTTALVGESGGGKSTLFKLICGYYPASEGTIDLFDVPMQQWELAYARSQIAYVAQETCLFPGTVADNIVCGMHPYNMEEVVAAAKSANIHDFILSLPEGYQSTVGERGMNLSGGQKQRIAIARAILKGAPILLLDEATSALDAESERLVQDALARLKREKTVIVAAHRLHTIRDADEVIVLEKGRIVERGTHEELVQQEGLYRRLYETSIDRRTNTEAVLDWKGA